METDIRISIAEGIFQLGVKQSARQAVQAG